MNREQLFSEVVRENRQRIFRICSRYFADPHDREDACQETLIRIWENLHTFKGSSKLSTWIYRVTVNTCLLNIRSSRRYEKLPFREVFSGLEATQGPAEPLEIVDNEEIRFAFIAGSLQSMSPGDRALVTLYAEGLSTRELADITGISEANVRVRIHRIRERIKNNWEDKQHERRD